MRAWETPLHLEGYTLGDVIGHGASGTVYTAKSTDTGRTYAAKKLAAEDTSLNEIGVLVQLRKHPNVMEYKESKFGRDGETRVLFVISEFCPLGNIGDFILGQHVDIVTKRKLAVQLADAIAFLHKNGVIHRDIKPQNVLLTGNEALLVLKVVDFGLAKVVTGSENDVINLSRSYMRSAVGTRFYLSPEVYQSLLNDEPCRYTSSVDIFSMGLLLWAMFDGISIPGSCQVDRYLTPFAGAEADPMPVAQALTQGDIELNVMDGEENIECRNLVRRMVSSDPKERPDANAVLETLMRGYGDYRVGQGVVRIAVDDNVLCGCTRRSCIGTIINSTQCLCIGGTDSNCSQCSCLGTIPNCFHCSRSGTIHNCSQCSCIGTGSNCSPCLCMETISNCLPCSSEGTWPSCQSCSCEEACEGFTSGCCCCSRIDMNDKYDRMGVVMTVLAIITMVTTISLVTWKLGSPGVLIWVIPAVAASTFVFCLTFTGLVVVPIMECKCCD